MSLQSTPTVTAQMRTDDYKHEVDFDCTAALAASSDQQVLDLVECGFSGDYAADAIADFYGGRSDEFANPDIDAAFAYLESKRNDRNAPGFEVSVDEGQAFAWILENRAHVMEM